MQKTKFYGLAVLLCLLSTLSRGQTALPYVDRDRLTILDFWASWCSACLHTFPHLDSLQAALGDTVSLVLVNAKETGDDAAKIRKAIGRFPHLASVTGDTAATALFPHTMLPHYVWLRHDSVLAVTGAEAVTAANIRAMLAGPVPLGAKKDIPVDFTKPILSPLAGSYVILSVHIAGLPGATGVRSEGDKLTGIYGLNMPVPALYALVNERLSALPANRIRWKGSLAVRYCYERAVPPMPRDSLFRLAQQDLDRFFGLVSGFKKVRTKCLVLVQHRYDPALRRQLDAGSALPVIEEAGHTPPASGYILLPAERELDLFVAEPIHH